MKGSQTPEKGVDREHCHITNHPGKNSMSIIISIGILNLTHFKISEPFSQYGTDRGHLNPHPLHR